MTNKSIATDAEQKKQENTLQRTVKSTADTEENQREVLIGSKNTNKSHRE